MVVVVLFETKRDKHQLLCKQVPIKSTYIIRSYKKIDCMNELNLFNENK